MFKKNKTSIQKTTTETMTTTTNNNNNNNNNSNNIPSRIDIENYLKEVGFSIDIDDFIAYNDIRGWKITNWKSAVRRWKKNETIFADRHKQKEKISKYIKSTNNGALYYLTNVLNSKGILLLIEIIFLLTG